MKWALTASIVCLGLSVGLFLIEPKAAKKGYGQVIAFMSLVLFLFAIGYLMFWFLRK